MVIKVPSEDDLLRQKDTFSQIYKVNYKERS